MGDAKAYARENGERYVGQLEEFTRIPSVSADPAYAGDIARAAEWVASHMRDAGFDGVSIEQTKRHPVVYGEWLKAGAGAKTVLLYAHYDVQPAMRTDGWDSEPFEPTHKDGRIFGRGIGDDKLHTVMIVALLESFLQSGEACPVNLKVVFEGEEEVGSPNLPGWVRANKERLAADYCLICDGGIDSPEQPTVSYALRGMTALEFTVHGPRADLHSGLHGGRVHNPAQVVAEMVAKLHDEEGRVAVPGFYDDVRPLSDTERAELQRAEMSRDQFDAAIGAPQPWGETGYSLVERATARPTLEINGIYGGYTGDGVKTVIPAKASAKITCRLVGDQSPDRIFESIRSYLEAIKPPTVTLDVTLQGVADPVTVPIDGPLVRALVNAYARHWEREPVYRRVGGTVPIVSVFQNELGLSCLVLGFNVENAGFHGPNEFIHEELFHKGLQTTIDLLGELSHTGALPLKES